MPNTAESIRQRIDGMKLADRLQRYAFGELKNKAGDQIEMTPGQLVAARTLLNKVSPDVKSFDMTVTQTTVPEVRIISYENAVIEPPSEIIDITPEPPAEPDRLEEMLENG